MRVIRIRKKKGIVTKLVLAATAIISVAVLVAGALTLNPILLGAGVAAVFLTCAGGIALRKPPQTYF